MSKLHEAPHISKWTTDTETVFVGRSSCVDVQVAPLANMMREQEACICLLLRCKHCNVSVFVWVGPMTMLVGYRWVYDQAIAFIGILTACMLNVISSAKRFRWDGGDPLAYLKAHQHPSIIKHVSLLDLLFPSVSFSVNADLSPPTFLSFSVLHIQYSQCSQGLLTLSILTNSPLKVHWLNSPAFMSRI